MSVGKHYGWKLMAVGMPWSLESCFRESYDGHSKAIAARKGWNSSSHGNRQGLAGAKLQQMECQSIVMIFVAGMATLVESQAGCAVSFLRNLLQHTQYLNYCCINQVFINAGCWDKFGACCFWMSAHTYQDAAM